MTAINNTRHVSRLIMAVCIYGDKGYIGADVQLDLFETAHIKLECPYRHNQKDWKPTFVPLATARKRYVNFINNRPIGRIKYALN